MSFLLLLFVCCKYLSPILLFIILCYITLSTVISCCFPTFDTLHCHHPRSAFNHFLIALYSIPHSLYLFYICYFHFSLTALYFISIFNLTSFTPSHSPHLYQPQGCNSRNKRVGQAATTSVDFTPLKDLPRGPPLLSLTAPPSHSLSLKKHGRCLNLQMSKPGVLPETCIGKLNDNNNLLG